MGPSLLATREHSIQERGQRSGARTDLGTGRPGVGNRCSEGTRCRVPGAVLARRLLGTGENAPGRPGPPVSHCGQCRELLQGGRPVASSPAPSFAHLSPRTPSRRLRRPHAPCLSAHEGSWTVGWASLAGKTSRPWTGRSPRPPLPQKMATHPALRSFQPTPLHAISQEAFQGRLWPSPFSLCSRRQARPTWTSPRAHVSSSLLGAENPGSGQDRPERSCPHAPRSHPSPGVEAPAAAAGRAAGSVLLLPLARGCSHRNRPSKQSALGSVGLTTSEKIVCFCFQFLGTDFLKFPYSYISYL